MVRLQAVQPGPGCDPHTAKVYTVLGMRSRRPRGVAGAPAARAVCGAYARTGDVAQATCPGRGRPRPDGGHSRCPGIGKSRLLRVPARLRGRRLTYLRGRCLSYGQATPYLPVLTSCVMPGVLHQRIGHRTLPQRYAAGCMRSAWCLTKRLLCSSPSWESRRTQVHWRHCRRRSGRPAPLLPSCNCACMGVSSATHSRNRGSALERCDLRRMAGSLWRMSWYGAHSRAGDLPSGLSAIMA